MASITIADFVDIRGFSQQTLTIGTSGAQVTGLAEGIYDVWADAECYVKVAKAGDTASDVTASTGYVLKEGNVYPVQIRLNDVLGGYASATTTLRYHRVG